MEKMNRYVTEYQKIYLEKQKITGKPAIIYIEGIAFFLLLSLLTYGIGSLFNILYNLDYLIIMFNIVVMSSYVVYKHLTARHYKQITGEEHPVWMINSLNYLYVLTIMISATAFLCFSVFFGSISLVLSILLAVIAIAAGVVYYLTETKMKRIVLPNTFNTLLNGFFIALLFYGLTLLIHIENVPLSFAVVMPVMLTLIVIKRYIEKRFIIHMKRFAIVGLGTFLILLSFPFTNAFNYVSFYRGEFKTRILYEELDEPVYEFSSEVQGNVVFYNNKLVVADDEEITFFDSNFEVEKTMDNPFVVVYTMNGELFANKRNVNNPTYADLYIYDGTDFVYQNSYYLEDIYDKVYLSEDNVQYFVSYDGYVYNDETGGLELQSAVDREENELLTSNPDFISFSNTRVFMASPESYAVEARGNIYNRITYHNDHFVFTYSSIYVARNKNIVHPDDDGETIVYLANFNDYLENNGEYETAVQLYKLFRIDQFNYYQGKYYLFGHVTYVNHDDVYMLYVINQDGEFEKEVVINDDTVAMSDEYIVYGEDQLRVYDLDTNLNIRYQLIDGYGLFFFTICLVSVFSIKDIHLNPKRDKTYKDEEQEA